MQSETPVSSPDVECYEECVVAEEDIYHPSANATLSDCISPIPRVNKDSGRVTKKSRGRRSAKGRKCSSPIILKWLDENYEMVPGACLPRSVLYTHYQDFCKRNRLEPSSAASFGKIIRVKFPNLSTRRLGTRGQSKYHYYGLAIKETSIYYRSVYSKQGLTRFSGASLKKENSQLYNPTSKTGILLPEFPKIGELNFSKPFPVEKVETFLLMYRAHCQRILDSVVRANFHEVQDFLVHFWQGMPQHMLPILNCQATVDLVVICDFILYNRLCEVLIPANLQQLPDNLVEEILSFSHKMVEWLFGALRDLPAPLGIRKVQTAEMFGKTLRRQTALVQLAKNARSVLRSSESVGCILNDWRSIDFEASSVQVAFPHQLQENSQELFKEFASELEQLLVKQSSLEVYFEWLDSLIERRVCEPIERGACSLQELSQDFMLAWNNFYHVVEKEVSFLKGKSFEYYRMVHIALSEYIHHVMEILQYKVIETQFHSLLINGNKDKLELPHPPKLEGSEALSLPPIYPPTPTSANDRDFIHYFENKITQEFQDNSFLSNCTSLHSPNYTNIMTESGLYDSFFKSEHERMFQQASCAMHPTNLPLDGINQSSFKGTPPPLTPISSYCSSSSPLSHASIHSPESCAMTPDLENTRPISQGSMYNLESPHVGDIAHTPLPMYNTSHSTTSSTCTSPLQHTTPEMANSLDIAASLDLVAGPEAGCVGEENFIHPGYGTMSHFPQYPQQPKSSDVMSPYLMAPPLYPGMATGVSLTGSGGNYTPHEENGYPSPHYNFELHHFSELLTGSAIEEKDTKPSLSAHTSTTPPAII